MYKLTNTHTHTYIYSTVHQTYLLRPQSTHGISVTNNSADTT